MKKHLFIVNALLAVSVLMISAVSCNAVEASTLNTKQKQEKVNRSGLMGYYFLDKKFSNIAFFTPSQESSLTYNKTKVNKLLKHSQQVYKGIEWIGYFKPSNSGDYKFKLSNQTIDKDSKISVNGAIVSDDGQETKSIALRTNQRVPIKITYTSEKGINYVNLKDLHIIADSGNKKENISNKELQNVQDTGKKVPNKAATLTYRDDSLDTDGDAIPDSMELNGYTISDEVAVPWTESLGSQYTKFVSNPYNAHTAGDPYTDFEKAAEQIDQATDHSAFNPLVAADPSVTVSLENLILSPNTNYSQSVSSSQSTGWSASNTIGASVTAEASLLPSLKVTADYSHTNTTTNDWGKTQGSDTSINSASAGYLNANARYYNTGTGAIYNVKPTTNFVLGDNTIATIASQDNTTALAMGAGEQYPQAGQHGIALNTMDNFSSSPITLNKNQLDNLMNNKKSLSLETTQTGGNFMKYDDNGNLQQGGSWSGYEEQIRNMTADFIIDTGKKATERHIAARNFDNPNDKTPILNIKEALKLAYPKGTFTEKKKNLPGATPILYFNDQPIDEDSFIGSMDANTQKMINKQLNSNSKEFKDVHDIFDVKLMPKMNITFKLPLYYNIASENNATSSGDTAKPGIWSETKVIKDSSTPGSYSFVNVGNNSESTFVLPSSISNILDKSDGSGIGTYMVSLYLKRDQSDVSNVYPDIYVRSTNNTLLTKKSSVKINNKYQRIDMLVYNGANNDSLSSVHITSNGATVDWNSLSVNKVSGLDLTH